MDLDEGGEGEGLLLLGGRRRGGGWFVRCGGVIVGCWVGVEDVDEEVSMFYADHGWE